MSVIIEGQPMAVNVDLWKQAAIQGTMSDDDTRAALAHLRQHRHNAAELGKKRKAAAGPVDTQALLSQLEGL